MSIGEGRVKSKSEKKNYHTFNLKRPIHEGWNVYKVI